MGTTDIAMQRIFLQLSNANAGLTIAEAKTYLAAWPNQQSQEKLETLSQEYQLMQQYWMDGIRDPQLEQQYLHLLQRIYQLCANMAIHRHITSSSYLHQLSNQVRQSGRNWSIDTIRDEMQSFVTDTAMLQFEPDNRRQERQHALYEQHQRQMNALFNYIVTARIWSDAVGQAFQQLLLSPTLDTNDQQLLVSAVTLSLMNRFDIVKFRLLINVYQQSQDEAVRQRALVGWVLGIDDDFLNVYPEQLQLIHQLLQSRRAVRELTELQIQLVYALNAERDTTTIQKEIMPDLLRGNQFRITRNGLEEIEEDELEDILHPDAAEQRMEQLEQSFQRMKAMQEQGADIYFGGFSQMKRFPFFYDMSNWLTPFFLQHPDIASFVNKLQDNQLLRSMIEHGPFCNSDKYSFVIAFQSVVDRLPASLVNMMKRGEAVMPELEGAAEQQHTPAYLRRIYLMDLYRFFRLFPNRQALCNPFDTTRSELGLCLIITSQLFAGTALDASKPQVVALLKKHHFHKAAKAVLDSFPHHMRDVQYYLWTEQYDRALELEPDNERALIYSARHAYSNSQFDQALDHYDRLLLLHPDNRKYMLNKAICLVELKDYQEALHLLYQLNYEQPENLNVSRTLAWTLTCDGKPQQAEHIYAQLTTKDNKAEDFENMGYCLWIQGRIAEAAQAFRKHIELLSSPGKEYFIPWETDLLSKHGISKTDIKMMQSLINS